MNLTSGTLSTAGLISGTSLSTISSEINVISRNISNANTAGYATRTANLVTGPSGSAEIASILRATNPELFRSQLQATSGNAQASALSSGIDQIAQFLSLSNSTVGASSPSAYISKFEKALQQYDSSPSDSTVAGTVVTAAKDLTNSLNQATTLVQGVRQSADTQIGASVSSINSILGQFQQVNTAIVSGTGAGQDVSDLQEQRDQLLNQLSSQIGISTVTRANNDTVILTDSGVTLFETTPRSVTFSPTATLSPGQSGNAVYVDGVQVTGQGAAAPLQSGQIVGLTQLRDTVAPQYQSQLDEVARGLVSAFAETDQTGGGASPMPGLFTFPGATGVPGATVVPGLAGQIQINAKADPSQGGNASLIRDGGIAGSAYTYNKTGASLYTGRIEQLLSSLSAPQSFDASTGLGASVSVKSFAASSDGWLASQQQGADNAATYQSALLSQSSQALSNTVGVNLDSQMSKMLDLENSYQATAKLMSTIDSMYTTLFNAIK